MHSGETCSRTSQTFHPWGENTDVRKHVPPAEDSRGFSCAALPPNSEAQHRRDERHNEKDQPAQISQRVFIKTENESLWNFRCDANELFTAQEPVHDAGNKIEGLLILPDGDVLNKGRVSYHYHARGISLDTFVGA